MDYRVTPTAIELKISACNDGKYRFKTRTSRLAFGESFSARKELFNESVYLEWQIGYDVPIAEVSGIRIDPRLKETLFIGSNGKRKYPYELSELYLKAIDQKFISKSETKDLLGEIQGYHDLIDERAIQVDARITEISLNGIEFKETHIKLPTLFMIRTLDGTQIEVSIKQQQYAAGVQPMVYFCIPFSSFQNAPQFKGRSSAPGESFVYSIKKENVKNLTCLMKVFGMASERHRHDIAEILKVIISKV